jgi:hypothetical protein
MGQSNIAIVNWSLQNLLHLSRNNTFEKFREQVQNAEKEKKYKD